MQIHEVFPVAILTITGRQKEQKQTVNANYIAEQPHIIKKKINAK